MDSLTTTELGTAEPHTSRLRLPGESETSFRHRARRAATIARVLVEACLANRCVQEFIADPTIPFFTVEGVTRSPIVRIEYEQAIAIGGLGETLFATRTKHWGPGPWVMPLEPEDWFFPERITYLYRENSLYNRRFEQRRRMKELLGKRWRKLVGTAKYHTKTIFLRDLSSEQARAIRRRLRVEPGEFWRAAQGKHFLCLPFRSLQREFDFGF